MIVLLPHCAFLSETTRMLHIARALEARGEPYAIGTHGGPYTRVLDDAGVPWTLLPPAMDAARCARFVDDLVRVGDPRVRLLAPAEVRAAVESEAAFAREHSARAMVIGFTLSAYLSSRVAGVALVSSHGGSYVPPVFERGLCPAPTTMPIPGTEWLPDWLKRALANRGPERARGPARFLNDVASELGVEGVPSLAAMMLADLTLVTDVPEVLGVPRHELESWRPRRPEAYRPGTRLTYVGPMFARLEAPIPEHVERFLDGSRPTAYVVLSSVRTEVLRAVVARVRAAGVRVIVGATIHDLGAINDPDVVVGGILPSHRVMPRVDVAVTMGGQGTVQTAMASGTPLVAMPLQPEQELNVGLAVRNGMAVAVAPRHAATNRVTDAVKRVLSDGRYRSAAQRVKRSYDGIDGAANAADAIVRYLSERQRAAASGDGVSELSFGGQGRS